MAVLEAADAALAEGGPPDLWHRFLDLTRRPAFLHALGTRGARHRWAEATFAAIRVSQYTLACCSRSACTSTPGARCCRSRPRGGSALELRGRRAAGGAHRGRAAARVARPAAGADSRGQQRRRGLRGPRLPRPRHPGDADQPGDGPREPRLHHERLSFNVVLVQGEEQRARVERVGVGRARLLSSIRRRLCVVPPRRGSPSSRRQLAPAQVERTLAAHAGPRPRPAGHRDVHVGQHRAAEGRRAHRPRHRHQALRARRGAARGGQRRDAAVLPAALPHVRPVPRDARDALLGRHLRVRGQPVVRDARARAAAGASDRPDRHPAPLGAAARALPRGQRGRRGRRCAPWSATACAGGCRRPAISTPRCSASSSATASSCAAASA